MIAPKAFPGPLHGNHKPLSVWAKFHYSPLVKWV
jgi:hypothetical protein